MPATPLLISGQGGLGSVPAGLGGFQHAYENMLNVANQTYSNVMSGFQGALAHQQQAQQGVIQGYADLERRVMDTIRGVEAPQRQAIADMYAQELGLANQALASAGLGNTTVRSSVSRGVLADRAKRENELAGQLAQLYAGTQSQLGQASLGYQGDAIRDNTSLATAQLGFMGSFLPQASQNLAALYGQSQQYGLDQQRLAQQQSQFDRQFDLEYRRYLDNKPYLESYMIPNGNGGVIVGDRWARK